MVQPEDNGAGPDPEWLAVGQAARYLGVAQSTLRKWADGGRVTAMKTVGGHRRFLRADLDAFLERSRSGEPVPAPVVLIVDDDARVRERVRSELEPAGYTVREAATAAEGAEALDEPSPDLILFVSAPFDAQSLVDSTKQLLPV